MRGHAEQALAKTSGAQALLFVSTEPLVTIAVDSVDEVSLEGTAVTFLIARNDGIVTDAGFAWRRQGIDYTLTWSTLEPAGLTDLTAVRQELEDAFAFIRYEEPPK